MKPNTNPQIDKTELEASLQRLGIRELEERMEISPLLTDTGTTSNEQEMSSVCCTCKIPDPFGPDGKLPYPNMGIDSTGPTNPNGLM